MTNSIFSQESMAEIINALETLEPEWGKKSLL